MCLSSQMVLLITPNLHFLNYKETNTSSHARWNNVVKPERWVQSFILTFYQQQQQGKRRINFSRGFSSNIHSPTLFLLEMHAPHLGLCLRTAPPAPPAKGSQTLQVLQPQLSPPSSPLPSCISPPSFFVSPVRFKTKFWSLNKCFDPTLIPRLAAWQRYSWEQLTDSS